MDDGSWGPTPWQRSLLRITVGACCLVILAEILRSDNGFGAAYSEGPWRYLVLLGAAARAVLRVPLVQLRVLADHPAAVAPVLGAMTFMGAALLADLKPHSRFASGRLLDLAGLILGVATLFWLMPLAPGTWGVGSDWEKDWVYYSAIDQAVAHLELPYYLRTSLQGTERYLANLETPWGPHVVLLRMIDPGSFFLAQALPLSLMIWIGGWHIFVWSYLFVLAFCASGRGRLLFLARVSIMVAALAAFRLLPAVTTFGGGSNEFMASYQNVSQFIAALIGGPLPGPEAHEYDAFVGWLGSAVAAIGAISYGVRARQPAAALWIPSVVMIVLSAFDLYKHTLFRLPGLVSERVVTRFAIIGVLGFALIGCARLSETGARRAAVRRCA